MGLMQIPRAIASDADQIAAVLLASFREFESRYTPAAFRATTPAASEIVARLAEGPIWVAKEGVTIVGTVSAVEKGEEIHLRSMAVLPTARGQGVAARLLTVVRAFAISQGARLLSLSTTPFLAAAIRLYQRSGFQASSEPLDLHGTPLIRMVKQLQTTPRHRSPLRILP
jgi:ribosomal protein S18 acetylase RimI-like enzyme